MPFTLIQWNEPREDADRRGVVTRLGERRDRIHHDAGRALLAGWPCECASAESALSVSDSALMCAAARVDEGLKLKANRCQVAHRFRRRASSKVTISARSPFGRRRRGNVPPRLVFAVPGSPDEDGRAAKVATLLAWPRGGSRRWTGARSLRASGMVQLLLGDPEPLGPMTGRLVFEERRAAILRIGDPRSTPHRHGGAPRGWRSRSYTPA